MRFQTTGIGKNFSSKLSSDVGGQIRKIQILEDRYNYIRDLIRNIFSDLSLHLKVHCLPLFSHLYEITARKRVHLEKPISTRLANNSSRYSLWNVCSVTGSVKYIKITSQKLSGLPYPNSGTQFKKNAHDLLKDIFKQKVLKRTNPLTFFALFNKFNSSQRKDTSQNHRILRSASVFVRT
jgi:hypothetical protein